MDVTCAFLDPLESEHSYHNRKKFHSIIFERVKVVNPSWSGNARRSCPVTPCLDRDYDLDIVPGVQSPADK
ncbi:hypothetical protein MRX96_052347 [Rhipicephalus microplus]